VAANAAQQVSFKFDALFINIERRRIVTTQSCRSV
jgi:hypothetical protein